MLKAFAEWLSDRNYLNRIDIDYDYDENPIENIYSLSANEVLEEYQERSYQEQTPEEYVKNWCDANFYTLVAKDVWEDLRTILNCDGTISRDPVEKKYWIKHRWNCWECPVCHNENGLYSNRSSAYCPDCGIKLEKKEIINESEK